MDVLKSITNMQSHNFNKGNPFFIKILFLILASLFYPFKF
jgi:hypothetical protein